MLKLKFCFKILKGTICKTGKWEEAGKILYCLNSKPIEFVYYVTWNHTTNTWRNTRRVGRRVPKLAENSTWKKVILTPCWDQVSSIIIMACFYCRGFWIIFYSFGQATGCWICQFWAVHWRWRQHGAFCKVGCCLHCCGI